MKEGIAPIKDILKAVLSQMSDRRQHVTWDFFKTWEDTVGEDIARHTRPVKLNRGELVVLVDSSSWLHELVFRYKPTILKGLKERMGEESINHIRFRMGDVKEVHGERD